MTYKTYPNCDHQFNEIITENGQFVEAKPKLDIVMKSAFEWLKKQWKRKLTMYKNNSGLIAKTKVSKYKKGLCLTEKLVRKNPLLFLYVTDGAAFACGDQNYYVLRTPVLLIAAPSTGLHQIA